MNDSAVALLARIVPLALGVALSPLPIVAVLVILLTRRARIGSFVFASAWMVGTACAITIAITFAGRLKPPRYGLDLSSEGLVTLLFGVGLIMTAWLSRRGRRRAENPDAAPAWVGAVDNLSPMGGALVAFSNALTSPKNLALAIAAGAFIQSATPPLGEETLAAIVYVLVASVFVVTPVVVYFVAGKKAQPILARWKSIVTARAAVSMELMLFVFGAALALKGLYNLLS